MEVLADSPSCAEGVLHMSRRLGFFALLLLVPGLSFAQTTPFSMPSLSVSGAFSRQTWVTQISGSAITSVSGLGKAVVGVSIWTYRERGLNCGAFLEATIGMYFNVSDGLTLKSTMPVSGLGSPQPFYVTAGQGAYLLRYGSGTLTLNIVEPSGTASVGLLIVSFSGTLPSPVSASAPYPAVATVTPGGIVPVYSSVPIIQPGSWVSIYGSWFANEYQTWEGDFPQSLGGVSVTINGRPAYLWYVSLSQINLQAPDDTATGCVDVVVKTPHGTVTSQVTLRADQPAFSIFPYNYAGPYYPAAEIMTPDGSGAYGNGAYDLLGPAGAFSFNSRPVKPGETLVLFGVGFGPTSPPVAAGKIFSAAAPLANPVAVTIGGVHVQPSFAGLVGSGLYQINLVVPPLPSGDQVITASVPGGAGGLFASDRTQGCSDDSPNTNWKPTGCAVYITVK
jgi:uncharacterized protein (TIGR03437 family)